MDPYEVKPAEAAPTLATPEPTPAAPAKQWVRIIAPGIDAHMELDPETIKGLVDFALTLAAKK